MTQTTATAQQIELATVDATGRTGATYGLTADAFAVGEAVEMHAQGKVRMGVVVKVGRTRVDVSWTTPTEVTNAAKHGRAPIAASKSIPAVEVGKVATGPARPTLHEQVVALVAELDEAAAPAAEPTLDEVIDAMVESGELVIPDADAELVEAVEEALAPAAPIHATREAWLTAATDALRPAFEAVGAPVPDAVRVSCGFPGGKSPSKVIGQCWYTADDAAPQVFVSPILDDAVDVLGVLVHELVHAWDGGKSGHKAAFAKVAKALGLEGKMTATTVGDALREHLTAIAAELGAYPHARLNLAPGAVKTQGTRMLKVECPACGYTLRTTAKWLEVGTPTCPCGEHMEAV